MKVQHRFIGNACIVVHCSASSKRLGLNCSVYFYYFAVPVLYFLGKCTLGFLVLFPFLNDALNNGSHQQGKWCHRLRHTTLTQDAPGPVSPSAYGWVQSAYNSSQTVPQRGIETLTQTCFLEFNPPPPSVNVQPTNVAIVQNMNFQISVWPSSVDQKKGHWRVLML